jgi:hypothetical protein
MALKKSGILSGDGEYLDGSKIRGGERGTRKKLKSDKVPP